MQRVHGRRSRGRILKRSKSPGCGAAGSWQSHTEAVAELFFFERIVRYNTEFLPAFQLVSWHTLDRSYSYYSKPHTHCFITTMRLLTVILASFPVSTLAAINGPCDDAFDFCICLDKSVCQNKWHGRPIQGSPGFWACPHDPANVWGCEIFRCKGTNTWCAWRSEANYYGLTILPGKKVLASTFSRW